MNEVAICVFLDNEGALDNTGTQAIVNEVLRRGIEGSLASILRVACLAITEAFPSVLGAALNCCLNSLEIGIRAMQEESLLPSADGTGLHRAAT
ncbi:hypothetical protein J6590_052787 [Homalodisca vitripennis]|nr:hypothetical protein J6590_052787 [Homalodisca vitripennis]